MSSRIISLIQPNFQQGPTELNAYYLPYTVGVLWAYVTSQSALSESLKLDQVIWRRDSIKQTAELLEHNDILLFSTYVWNREYNYELARTVKKLNPNVVCVFGGPEIPVKDKNIFSRYNFIDYVVVTEGEQSLAQLLNNLVENQDCTNIPGLLINKNGQCQNTGSPVRIDDLSVLPSPYLTGFFDDIVNNNLDVKWNATLETNRGCPFQCTFCDWGGLTYSKVKKFSIERVLGELEWIGKHCIYLTIADANFGIFADRDHQIADKIIEVQARYKKLEGFNTSWAKNTNQETLAIIKKFLDNKQGPTSPLMVSVQTMDEDVLDIIKRKNLNMHKLEEIFSNCTQQGIPVYSEMILGLPGETLQSWKKSIFKIFQAGNHHGIDVAQAQMLENTEMNHVQKSIYDIETAPVYDYLSRISENTDAMESIQVVTATASLPRDDMLEAQTWTSFILAFHCGNLSNWLSRFVCKHQGMNLETFYELLYNKLKTDPWIREELADIKNYFNLWTTQGYFDHPPIGGVPIVGINVMYRMTLDIHLHNKIDHVFDLLEAWIQTTFDIPADTLSELAKFQKSTLVRYCNIQQYPKVDKFSHDFIGWIVNDSDLANPVQVQFDFLESKTMSQQRFHENLYFGRRRYFGQAALQVKKL